MQVKLCVSKYGCFSLNKQKISRWGIFGKEVFWEKENSKEKNRGNKWRKENEERGIKHREKKNHNNNKKEKLFSFSMGGKSSTEDEESFIIRFQISNPLVYFFQFSYRFFFHTIIFLWENRNKSKQKEKKEKMKTIKSQNLCWSWMSDVVDAHL